MNELLDKVHFNYNRLVKYLIENNIKISTMESCTCGLIGSLITDTQGASMIYSGSMVAYSNASKIDQGISEEMINEFGVYSEETALSMAKACMNKFDSNIGIGVTGSIGTIDPNNIDSVPGKVYLAMIFDDNEYTECMSLKSTDRFEGKLMIADRIFEIIYAELNNNKPESV